MIDINTYRLRIGYYNQKMSKTSLKNCSSREHLSVYKSCISRRKLLTFGRSISVNLLIVLVTVLYLTLLITFIDGHRGIYHAEHRGIYCEYQDKFKQELSNCRIKSADAGFSLYCLSGSWQLSSNFYARLTYGNKVGKGLKNIHLNVRSLGNKMSEIKNMVNQYKPHIFGISECELKWDLNLFQESKLKIPGYDLLFPKSWEVFNYARVVMYVKSTLHYKQVHELEDEMVQSVWIKGGFKNMKQILFCHAYREHTNTMGNTLQHQRDSLERFLRQWEVPSITTNGSEPNEIHICGDMNLDVLDEKWLQQSYHLLSLSKMVQSACALGNFTQLVNVPTRFQFNSVTGVTAASCIDHVYTNYRFRSSEVNVHPFGNSDHELLE